MMHFYPIGVSMKKITALTTFFSIALLALPAVAQVHVRGYMRSNGTYVHSYERSAPDNTVTNNYSYQGNTNPYTGATGTNRYQHDTTSPYFNGTPDNSSHIGHAGNGMYGQGNYQ